MKHKNLVPLSEDMECMTTTNGYADLNEGDSMV